MRRCLFIVLLVMCSIHVSVAHGSALTIKGKVEGIKKGRLYLLAQSSEEGTDTLGVCDFKRGKFELEASIDEPLFARLVVEGYSGGFTFFAEPGVKYNACLSEGDNFYIKGGTLNERYTAHMKVSDSLRAVIAGMQVRYDSLRAKRKYRSSSLVNDSLRREQAILRDITKKFLDSNDNIIAAYTIYTNIVMREAGLREARSMYASLGSGAKASRFGRIIEERIDRLARTDQGAKAPDFTLPDTKGNQVTMSSIKGKIKIIDFWASWCGPCRLNNPALRKLYDEFHDKGLEIIGVSLDTDKESWEMAIEKDGLIWVNVSSLKGWDCETISLYNVSGVPSLFILDEYNNIMATGLRGEQLRNFLQDNLGK